MQEPTPCIQMSEWVVPSKVRRRLRRLAMSIVVFRSINKPRLSGSGIVGKLRLFASALGTWLCSVIVSGAALGAGGPYFETGAPRTHGEATVLARDCGSVPGWSHLRRVRLPSALSSWPPYTILEEHRVSSAGHCVLVFAPEPEPELPFLVKLVQRQGTAPGSLYAMPLDLWAASQEPLQAWQGLEGRGVTLPAPAASCRTRLLDLQGRTVAYLADGALLLELAGEWLRLEMVGTAGGRQTFGGQRRVGLIAVDHRVATEAPSGEARQEARIPIAFLPCRINFVVPRRA
jgi:hypothetical protein